MTIEVLPVIAGDVYIEFAMDPAETRRIIDGLRALPNVSDMAVLRAIAEFDRIATTFESLRQRRQEATDRESKLREEMHAEAKPLIEEAVKNGENILFATMRITQEIYQRKKGGECQCPRCTARRAAEASGQPLPPNDSAPGNTRH